MFNRSRVTAPGSFIASVIELVESSDATGVSSKHFEALILGEERHRVLDALLTPLANLGIFLEQFQFEGSRPFTLAATALHGLLVDAPESAAEFKEANEWVEKLNQLLNLIETDANGRGWGRHSAFSVARSEIAAFKSALEQAKNWSPDDDFAASTLLQVVIGPVSKVNSYTRAFARQVSKYLPDHAEEQDLEVEDPQEPMLEFLGLPKSIEPGNQVLVQKIEIHGYGEQCQLPMVDFREPGDTIGEVPNLKLLMESLNTIGAALRNIPGHVLKEAEQLHSSLFDAIDSKGTAALKSDYLQRQLTQLVTDLETEIGESDVKIPDSSKPTLTAAINSIKAEVPKLKNLRDIHRDCVVRVIVCPIIGVKQHVNKAVSSIGELVRAITSTAMIADESVEFPDPLMDKEGSDEPLVSSGSTNN